MPNRFRKWPPSASEPPGVDAGPIATSPAGATIDNLTVALGMAQQVANIVQKVPFITPAAALMSELLKVHKEVKDTDEKRDVLLANIAELTRDLCGTILRMEATNHVELIGRLKADIEAYADYSGRPPGSSNNMITKGFSGMLQPAMSWEAK
ncbi:hypothetical protein DFH09DRAFT_1274818 [Mycena vulgaris]|nr:hypothetical protein DFH09DRAFT_1274818 [Mycena vulgaris]